MPAYPDSLLCPQPLLADLFAAHILKHLGRAVRGLVAKDHVRDQLLVTRILFRDGSGQKLDVFRPQKLLPVLFHVGAKALKPAQLVEQTCADNQYLLFHSDTILSINSRNCIHYSGLFFPPQHI